MNIYIIYIYIYYYNLKYIRIYIGPDIILTYILKICVKKQFTIYIVYVISINIKIIILTTYK